MSVRTSARRARAAFVRLGAMQVAPWCAHWARSELVWNSIRRMWLRHGDTLQAGRCASHQSFAATQFNDTSRWWSEFGRQRPRL